MEAFSRLRIVSDMRFEVLELMAVLSFFFFKQKTAYEILYVTGVQTCALPILSRDHVERRLREDPLLVLSPGSVRDARQVLGGLVPFFAPGGRFETLLERVHGSARDVVRRVHRHVENVRARNIRIETLRDRTREMARLAEEELDVANAWIN